MNPNITNTLARVIQQYSPYFTKKTFCVTNNHYHFAQQKRKFTNKDSQQINKLNTSASLQLQQKARQQLSQILTKQIQSQSASLYNQSKYQQLLQIINWSIKHQEQKSILELNKFTPTHAFFAFVTIKPPIQLSQQNKLHRIQQKQLQIQMLQEQLKNRHQQSIKKHIEHIKNYLKSNPFDEPFLQITIFIQNLNPKSKYLCIQYLANSQHVQIQQMSMMSKITPNKIQRLQQCHEYDGRLVHSLDMERREMLFLLTQTEYQLRKQVLQTIFQLTCCYQQRQYINWLKKFNSIL